jgi:hypothetical protein
MTPQSAKAKGRRLQQKVRDAILTTFPELDADDVTSCSMGAGGEDVKLSPAARRLFGFSIECKKRKAFAVYGDYDQARRHGPHEPLLIIEADRRKPLAVVDLATFLELVERAGRKI